MEVPVKWLENSALMMCSDLVKGDWNNSRIMVIDLETKGYEIQKINDGELTSIKAGKENLRNNIKETLPFEAGRFFEPKFQNVKPQKK